MIKFRPIFVMQLRILFFWVSHVVFYLTLECTPRAYNALYKIPSRVEMTNLWPYLWAGAASTHLFMSQVCYTMNLLCVHILMSY